ncbi:MAG: M56 family metallopeptidase [Thermoflexaceae bacterium]|nr:M56 family metallopeptidase [Thermoflexaceae bacterium]
MASSIDPGISLRVWSWAAVGRRFCRADGHLIELGAFAGMVAALVSLVLPLWLAFTMTPDAHPVNRLLEACQQGVRRGPLVLVGYGAVALLTAWATLVLGRLTWRGSGELLAIQRQGRDLGHAEEVELCAGGQAVAVRLLATDMAVAFSAGLVRPRIHVSGALLRRVSASELEATLLHELAHARRRDPLRCWLVELAVWSLWFPRTSWLGPAYRAARESRADAVVVGAMNDDRPLLRALVRVDALSTSPGSCGLTSDREQARRKVRDHGLAVGRSERAALILGLSVVVTMMFVAVAGLSDWQSYWFCPNGTSMQG